MIDTAEVRTGGAGRAPSASARSASAARDALTPLAWRSNRSTASTRTATSSPRRSRRSSGCTSRWRTARTLPLLEAESVVRSLAVAMHGDQEMLLPLLTLREFDEYTTTHSLNVSVLTMALAEAMGMGARDVRAFGVAGLLHDLGKTRIPLEILNKPGKLTDEERAVMQGHTVEGARLILVERSRARPRRRGGVRASHHAQRGRLPAPRASRGSATARARSCTCATSTTRCARTAPIARRGSTTEGAPVHRGGRRHRLRPGRRAHLRRPDAPHGRTHRALARWPISRAGVQGAAPTTSP